MKKTFRYLAFAVMASLLGTVAIAATYVNDFNTDPSAEISIRPHSKWVATGGVDGTGYLSITDAVNSQDQAGAVLPNLDPGTAIGGFNASFRLRIGGGTCCDAERGADGFSFSFVPETDPSVTAGGVGEEGPVGALITVAFDTWDNNGTDSAPSIEVKINNLPIAFQSLGGIREANRAPAGPLLTDGSGNVVKLRTDAELVPVTINLDSCGLLDLTYKGLPIFTDLPTGFRGGDGRFVFGARTGGANDNHWVDDLQITTVPAKIFVSKIEPTASTLVPLGAVLAFEITDTADSILDASFRDDALELRVNGVVIPAEDYTLTYTLDENQINTTRLEYSPAGGWAASSTVTAELTFSDVGEPPHVCTVEKVFETHFIGPDALFIEAEDFNYRSTEGGAGNFFDFGSPAGSYQGLAAVHDVDYHQMLDQADSPEYRLGESPNVPMSIPGTPDNMRGDTVLSVDYKVGWNAAGDWYNYTRTFPNDTYKIYARLASDGAPLMVGELSEVTSDPTQPSQTVSSLGTFNAPKTAGWDTFTYVPLRDVGGNDVIVRLSGLRTVRFTVQPGDLDFNYLAFVPVDAPALTPIVASSSPTAGSTAPSRSPLITVSLADRDTRVVASSVRLYVNDEEVTAGSTVTDTDGGADISYQPTSPLPALSQVNVRVTFVDDSDPAVVGDFSWSFRTDIHGPEALFIEAEDFNYTENGVAGLHTEFGDPDGVLREKGGTAGVDYNDDLARGDGPCCDPSRIATGVEAAKGPLDRGGNPGGNDVALRGDRDITINFTVGWTAAGEWLNFTRTFPNRRYNVYGRLASGETTGQPMAIGLGLVGSDPTQPNQSVANIGEFRAPATGGWDTMTTVPLRDASGNLASVRLRGLTTVRATWLPGASDLNWLAFVPAEGTFTPQIGIVLPAPNTSGPRAPLVRAEVTDEDTAVVVDSLRLIIDGVDVTGSATIIDTERGAEIQYQLPPAAVPTMHTARVEWTDDSDPAVAGSYEWTFTESVYSTDNLFIEAEDFNTDFGSYFPSNPATGQPFDAKGLYNGLGGVLDIDFKELAGNAESDLYRNGESPNIGMVQINDANMGGAGPRPGFELVSDFKIGWTDAGPNGAGGDWYNYTRTFPAGTYHVYVRAAHGDINATIGGQLDQVTSDPSLAEQTVTKLGTFRAPATGGWDTMTFIPLKDDNGDMVIVSLAGEQTLRYTVQANGGDINYLMLVTAVPPCGDQLNIFTEVVLEWTGPGTLEWAPDLTGPWTPLPEATSPYRAGRTTGERKFYRVVCPE